MRQLEDREHMFDVAHQHWLENKKLEEHIARRKLEIQAEKEAAEHRAFVEEWNRVREQKDGEANAGVMFAIKFILGLLAVGILCHILEG